MSDDSKPQGPSSPSSFLEGSIASEYMETAEGPDHPTIGTLDTYFVSCEPPGCGPPDHTSPIFCSPEGPKAGESADPVNFLEGAIAAENLKSADAFEDPEPGTLFYAPNVPGFGTCSPTHHTSLGPCPADE